MLSKKKTYLVLNLFYRIATGSSKNNYFIYNKAHLITFLRQKKTETVSLFPFPSRYPNITGIYEARSLKSEKCQNFDTFKLNKNNKENRLENDSFNGTTFFSKPKVVFIPDNRLIS